MKKKKHTETGMFWKDDLANFAEKYCKHNNSKLNNCLYWILYPVLEKYFKKNKKK